MTRQYRPPLPEDCIVSRTVGPKVKICGIMQPEHAVVAAKHQAFMIGMVFAPSRRQISVETAQNIQAALDAAPAVVYAAGVFVNEASQRVIEIADAVGLDVLQLSGDETPAQVAECLEAGYPVIKAVRFPADYSVEQALEELAPFIGFIKTREFWFLLDTYRPGTYGGSGEIADWSLAAGLAWHVPLYLAGGLTPDNVREAIEAVHPYGVDVSSGVERDGVKDSKLIREFIEASDWFRRLKGRQDG